ncbi:MAG TPA: hypothetical protein VN980_06285 [Alphaproteobacteria bacterium]|nr:hypothetical protein [Alphaproteobacteria bacterium]
MQALAIEIRLGVLYPTHRLLARVARAFLSVLRRRRNELLRGGAERCEACHNGRWNGYYNSV